MSTATATQWKEVKIGDVAKIITGKTPPTIRKELFGNEYPFITPTDIDEAKMFCVAERKLSEKGKEYQSSLLLPPKSICFTSIASVGKICITDEPSFTNQQINSLIAKDGVADYRFLFYALKYYTPALKRIAGGTMTSIINKTQFENFIFSLPELREQKSIADVLSALDNKIELLQKQNETLEQIAQVIFNERFTSKTANGELPEGWKSGTVGDVLSLEYGKSLIEQNRRNGDYPVVGSSGVVGHHDSYLVEGAGVVIGRKGTVGSVMWIEDSFFPIDTTFYVSDKLGVAKLYYHYYLLRSLGLNKIGSHSAVPGLSRDAVYAISTSIPTQQAIDNFSDLVEPLYNKKNLNNRQISALTTIRDTLLPKLVRSELRVSN